MRLKVFDPTSPFPMSFRHLGWAVGPRDILPQSALKSRFYFSLDLSTGGPAQVQFPMGWLNPSNKDQVIKFQSWAQPHEAQKNWSPSRSLLGHWTSTVLSHPRSLWLGWFWHPFTTLSSLGSAVANIPKREKKK